jgi:hypothetical protein
MRKDITYSRNVLELTTLRWFGGSCPVTQMSTEVHALYRCILQASKGELGIVAYIPELSSFILFFYHFEHRGYLNVLLAVLEI